MKFSRPKTVSEIPVDADGRTTSQRFKRHFQLPDAAHPEENAARNGSGKPFVSPSSYSPSIRVHGRSLNWPSEFCDTHLMMNAIASRDSPLFN
jgi:hypothetical protein